jgi:hypothetical protein
MDLDLANMAMEKDVDVMAATTFGLCSFSSGSCQVADLTAILTFANFFHFFS